MNKILFLNSLALGTLISISALSWFSMWIGLELNLLSFIPLMNENKNNFSSEASLKYFIIQAISSMFILFVLLMFLNLSESLNLLNSSLNLMLNSALFTKMGAAPFHFWFPEIVEGLSWMNSLILLTWQKIAPMVLLMYNNSLTFFFLFVALLSMLVGSVLSWNQTSMKKILVFSSMNHMGWMIPLLFLNLSIWSMYFFVYSIITFSLIFMLNKLKISSLNQLFLKLNQNKIMKILFFLNLFSLGGLPPFLGFLPKWLVLNILMIENFWMVSIFMVFLTLIMLYTYIRLTFHALTLNLIETKPHKLGWNWSLIFIFNFLNIFGLLSFSILWNL